VNQDNKKLIPSAIEKLPASLQIAAQDSCERAEKFMELLPNDQIESAIKVLACSPFAANNFQRNPQWASAIQTKEHTFDDLQQSLSSIDLSQDEAAIMQSLRLTRNREMVRIAWQDLTGRATLEEVMQSLSDLADGSCSIALQWATSWLAKTHGQPIGRDSARQVELVVLGLGKLGGCELNFSSDIDLMFAYSEDGNTDGSRPISNHEFFTKLGRQFIKLLSESTKDGFVFRVDMRLRPNGNSGPLALSFDAMEHYYQTHGRDWERYALVKMRPVAGDIESGNDLIATLRPFIYRKYLDFGAVESIREMKLLINQELKKKGIENNVKLGAGGIREIEFIGQSFQLIRGGRDRNLQQRSILKVLPLLVKNGQLTAQGLKELETAYDFLRRTEHRIQMIADQQSHLLPTGEVDRARVAFGMGFSAWEEFHPVLLKHMRKVHDHFSQVFTSSESKAPTTEAEADLVGVWRALVEDEQARQILATHGYEQPEEALRLLNELRGGRAYVAFSSAGRERMDRLLPLLVAAAGLTEDPNTALTRLVKLVETIGRRSSYFVLLVENPLALSLLVKLCAASAWIADWISRHPVVMDELIDAVALYRSPTLDELRSSLNLRLSQFESDDLESQMGALRDFHHGQVLRVAASELGPGLAPEAIGARLSNIAEVLLQASLDIASTNMSARHGRPDCGDDSEIPFIVISYGKLGSHELGYSSDLDLAFIYGNCKAGAVTSGPKQISNETFFARLGQRLIHILNTRTVSGNLYDVDMRLRPSGQSGALVTSADGFEKYQLERAWVWEHQALVRARPVAGPQKLKQRFLQIRKNVLCRQREAGKLRNEILEMRNRMREAQSPTPAGEFNLKHDVGGIVDIEFMVQYGVLSMANKHPELVDSTNNYELLSQLEGVGFFSPGQCEILQTTYLYFLGLEYQRKLTGKPSVVPLSEFERSPQLVREIWQAILEEK